MLIVCAAIYGSLALVLLFVAFACWSDPDSRYEGFPLALLFVAVCAYRSYHYQRLIPRKRPAV
jgi:hypothetical protein